MGGTALAGLLGPPGCALALPASAAANCRFHHRIGMQVPNRHGYSRLCLGKIRAARAGVMALSIPTLRSPVGAAPIEETRPSLGPASHEPMTVTVPHTSLVSVILPTFNRLQFLSAAVDSVFSQSFED